MNRLVLLLALATTATGCVVSDTCDARTARVTWGSFLRADGATGTCGNASVSGGASSVDVFFDGTRLLGSPYACGQGFIDVTGVLTGGHDVTVEALDAGGNILLRHQVTFNAAGCSDELVATQPGEGYADLDYDFYVNGVLASPDACVPGSRLLLSLLDTVANAPAYSYPTFASAPSCDNGLRLRLPVPEGSFRLDWMEERSSASTLESSDCAPKSFAISAAQATSVAVRLDEAGLACH